MKPHPPVLHWGNLGLVPYSAAWSLQKNLREQRLRNEIPDTLLLLEHPPTITLGCLRGEKSLQRSTEELEAEGFEVIISDRGGDATLHAPGQLVGYLIVDLAERQQRLPHFVEDLSAAIQNFLQGYQVESHYDRKLPGVWIEHRKIAAFGFHLKQNVTMHGFALNLQTDLNLFSRIIPCGLQEKGVASLQEEISGSPTPLEAAPLLVQEIASVLQMSPTEKSYKNQLELAL